MNDATPRRLVLLRHAKAQPSNGVEDHERSLVEGGQADAQQAGRWLREEGIEPDLVLCSTAARARETWAAVVEASKAGTVVEHDPRIYQAPAPRLLTVLREADSSAQTLVLVGHAPGVPDLAAVLSDGQADPLVLQELARGFATCTLAVLDLETDWPDLAPGAARVIAVHTLRA